MSNFGFGYKYNRSKGKGILTSLFRGAQFSSKLRFYKKHGIMGNEVRKREWFTNARGQQGYGITYGKKGHAEGFIAFGKRWFDW